MNRRLVTTVAFGAVAVVVVPLSATATTAAWTDEEWNHGIVGTSSLICGDDTGFATTAYGRFLSGSLLGTNLNPVADLEQMRLVLDENGALTVQPTDAVDLDPPATPPTHTYANPFDVDLLGIAGVNMSGFEVPVPGAALGAANQYAQVSELGTAVGASGLVNNSGVVTAGTTPSASLPAPATISLDELLPALTGIAGADLKVGAIGASSQLDGCAALLSTLWGAGTVSGSTRDYAIAGLGLGIDVPAAGGLVGTTTTGAATITTAVNSLLGSSGLISSVIGSRLDLALPGALTTSIGGTVSIAGLDLAGSVTTLLNTPLTDGVVTVDLQTSTVDVDLDALLPSLNNAPPNTEVVVNSAVLAPIVTRVGVLLNNWTSQVITALRQELRTSTITIDLNAVVAAPGIFPLQPLDILNVSIDFVGQVGAILDGTAVFTVDANTAGAVGAINTLLAALALPTVTALINTVELLSPVLVTVVANQITTTAVGAITTLGTTLSTAVNAVIARVGSVVNALRSILSLMVNVQPDRPGAPPGSTFVAGTADSTPQYLVSALRIGLADASTPASIDRVVFATASAGPVTAP
ncbi:choice-of-anchor G family protein [Microbacterium sp. P07]|uniref:choice-of-anchor G family protein n=1 Tax=Microbacterium sp. P07 TaxID=3366952 RepID=UPI0037473AD6